MKKYWIVYSVVGGVDSPAYNDEVEFRSQVLGPRHWSSMSLNGDKRTISLRITEEEAQLFILKFADCRILKVDND